MVKGFLVESYIEDGNQKIGEGVYGKSITDVCLGWEKSEKMILEIAELLWHIIPGLFDAYGNLYQKTVWLKSTYFRHFLDGGAELCYNKKSNKRDSAGTSIRIEKIEHIMQPVFDVLRL